MPPLIMVFYFIYTMNASNSQLILVNPADRTTCNDNVCYHRQRPGSLLTQPLHVSSIRLVIQ
ncbi:predicted protein [Plenodomus lingam JN3]|uniref:Uncharacterized protein n=1 Tax=Leptosphaeria maculans (strain JN3 / isolate v23.1.3 / race Av1-4-5-6-7-8) TaxID=985895 RepID=E5A6F5_LEPMJ|nr:predicted protein [Plenodomus lingam JN3]CBX99200.1 predicted protein [Plenodomus lingam JN3]